MLSIDKQYYQMKSKADMRKEYMEFLIRKEALIKFRDEAVKEEYRLSFKAQQLRVYHICEEIRGDIREMEKIAAKMNK